MVCRLRSSDSGKSWLPTLRWGAAHEFVQYASGEYEYLDWCFTGDFSKRLTLAFGNTG
jgi:hypothetical protein